MTKKKYITIKETQKLLQEEFNIYTTEPTLRNWVKRFNLAVQPGGPRSILYIDKEALRRHFHVQDYKKKNQEDSRTSQGEEQERKN